MSNLDDDARTVMKLTSVATSTIHTLRQCGETGEIDVEVSERYDHAEITETMTMRVRVKGR